MIIEITSEDQFEELIAHPKVLVEFYSKTCGPCKMLAFVLKDVDKVVEDVKILTVDFDQFEDLKTRYGVAGFPTMIILSQGKESERFQGLKQKKLIIDAINNA